MKAIEIISTQAVKGSSDKHLPQLVQTKCDASAPPRLRGVPTTIQEDQKYLSDLTATCEQKALAVAEGGRPPCS